MRVGRFELGILLLGLGGLVWAMAALSSNAIPEAWACASIGIGFLVAYAAHVGGLPGRTLFAGFGLAAAGSLYPALSGPLRGGAWDPPSAIIAAGALIVAAAVTLGRQGFRPLERMGLALVGLGSSWWVVMWIARPDWGDLWTPGNVLVMVGGILAATEARPPLTEASHFANAANTVVKDPAQGSQRP